MSRLHELRQYDETPADSIEYFKCIADCGICEYFDECDNDEAKNELLQCIENDIDDNDIDTII